MAEITDLELAVNTLKAKSLPYTTAWKYYDNPQPIKYSTERLKDIFKNINARFTNNWIAVAVDATVDRLELERFAVMDETGEDEEKALSDRLNEIWTATEMDGDEESVETSIMVTGESYVITWKRDGEEGDGRLESYYNDSRNCHMFYEPDNPKQKRFAAKWWMDDSKVYYLTLYYPDKLYYYSTGKAIKDGSNLKPESFKPMEIPEADNPFGFIPAVHFRYSNRTNKSAIINLVEPQDAFNKLLNDMMVSSEFGAFKQRWAVTNADLSNLSSAPQVVQEIPASDGISESTQVGEWSANEPTTYTNAMDTQANYIAIESKLPKHYFFVQGGAPSGEALIALEAPLNKRCQKIIDKQLAPAYQELGHMLLKLDDKEVDRKRIVPIFARPETVQPLTQAQIYETLSANGNAEGAADIAGYTEMQVQKLTQVQAFGTDEVPR